MALTLHCVSNNIHSKRGVARLLRHQLEWIRKTGIYIRHEDNPKIDRRAPFDDRQLGRVLEAAIKFLSTGPDDTDKVLRPDGISHKIKRMVKSRRYALSRKERAEFAKIVIE